jgi:hypothetical protein
MANEAFVLDCDTTAHKGVAGDLAPCPDRGATLNLDERTNCRLVAYLASVKVDERRQADIPTEDHIITDHLIAC